jgi:hypothetical protein
MIIIPQLDFKVDEERWGDPFDPNDEDQLTTENISGYIAYMIMIYQSREYKDNELWEIFHEDFENFTVEIFSQAHRQALRDLRTHLENNGVWIRRVKGLSYTRVLKECLEEKNPHEWTEQETRERNRSTHQSTTQPAQQTQASQLQTPGTERAIEAPVPPRNRLQWHQQRTYETPQPPEQSQSLPPFPSIQQQRRQSHQPYEQFPIPRQGDKDDTPSKLLTDLMKIYNSDERKYGGEEYDILDIKLQVFYDCCSKIGIQETHYHAAFSVMLKGRASNFYYDKIAGRSFDFKTMVSMTKTHFETEENHQKYLSEWRETTFQRTISANPEKSRLECFQIMVDKLQNIQRGLSREYQYEHNLRDQVISACRGVEECNLALYKPANTFEGVCAELRSAIGTAMRSRDPASAFNTQDDGNGYGQNWTDRTYGGRGRRYDRGYGQRGGGFRNYRGVNQRNQERGNFRRGYRGNYGESRQKKCYVCEQPGCWSTKHSVEERQQAYNKFRQYAQHTVDHEITPQFYQSFLAQFEGVEGIFDNDSIGDVEQCLMEMEIDTENYLTELGEVNGVQTVAILNDQSTLHAIVRKDLFNELADSNETSAFTFDNRYSSDIFQGIMPDSGAAGVSTAGNPQFLALQKLDPRVQLDTSTAGDHKIRFGKGTAFSQGTIQVHTPIGVITFHVVLANTPFLFCIQDMDAMGVKFDNLRNVLIQGDKVIPVVRKWGHPWMLLYQPEHSLAWSHLTELELRQLHRRFGHPSVRRLVRILERAGHDPNTKYIQHLTKYCHQCQMHGKSPGRFKFTLKDDYEFNYSVIIDVLYLDGRPVLQVVDSSTSFQAARFLKDMSAKNAWDTLRMCWIDTYQGPPEYIVHDAGKNFSSTEFRQHAGSMAIEVKEVPIEAHNSIGKVERYHIPLRRSYEIIRDELNGEQIDKEIALQMAVKAVNDSAGPDGIVPTLLVFGAYPRMTDMDPPSPSIVKRAQAIHAATKEVRRLYAERQVNDALAMRNGPNTKPTLDLPINSDVRVWREKGGWKGPYKLLATNCETCTVAMPHGPANFRSTVVKPYYTGEAQEDEQQRGQANARQHDDQADQDQADQDQADQDQADQDQADQDQADQVSQSDDNRIIVEDNQPKRRGRGRPLGSRNKSRPMINVRRSNRQHFIEDIEDFDDQFIIAIIEELETSMAFMTNKEQADMELSIKLRKEGIITTPGAPFEASWNQEINGLIAKGVFKFEEYNPKKHVGIRIFNSRLVNEVKGKATDSPYEKSRLVIQAYNDEGKEMILTQSPTIQRASQRVIAALAPSLFQLPDKNIKMWLRDITQAYVQSTTSLNRLILARPPKEIQHMYSPNTIMVVLKPLYGIPEAGTHWWATYHKHHKEKLSMVTSTYDPCLLITTTEDVFGIVGMQTDDTLILGSEEFSVLENDELTKANLSAKPKEVLCLNTPLIFNGCILIQHEDTVEIRQKEQARKLKLVDAKSENFKHEYMEQRARGAYIATICQPEAAFDLSVAAQHQNPTESEATALNKRLDWQIKHMERGIRYIALDLATVKLFVFVDGSFANNKDFSSQIGYEIIVANEITGDEVFEIKGNLIHYSSTKSKRVTRSVLASEIYGMVGGVDMAIAINTTIKMIMDQLGFTSIPIIVCTDSYSLYECLVKLGTTKEKRLMIDIMAIRQSYERRELQEIRWINGQDNPADAMTKSNPNRALEKFLDTNHLQVRIEGWVKRGE